MTVPPASLTWSVASRLTVVVSIVSTMSVTAGVLSITRSSKLPPEASVIVALIEVASR